MNVQCSSQTETEPGDSLMAEDVKAWIEGVPNGASISAVLREQPTASCRCTPANSLAGCTHGTGRGGPHLVGLRASWSEDR